MIFTWLPQDELCCKNWQQLCWYFVNFKCLLLFLFSKSAAPPHLISELRIDVLYGWHHSS